MCLTDRWALSARYTPPPQHPDPRPILAAFASAPPRFLVRRRERVPIGVHSPGEMEVEKVLERAFAALEVGKLLDPEGAVAASTAMEVEVLEGAVAARSPAEGDKILEGAVASRTAMEVDKVPEVRPWFVWGRRPRPNGGRRRPRGRYGFYKHASVVSRGSYPISDKLPLGAGPQLDQVISRSSSC